VRIPWDMSRTLAAVAAAVLVASCGGTTVSDDRVRLRSVSELSDEAKAALSGARVFFGHQSVGSNIMAGVSDVVRDDPRLALRVLELAPGEMPAGGFFAHAKVGQNGQPAGKTDDFADRMDKGLAAKVDIAFHKYCYIDVNDKTDANALFAHYKATMGRLRSAHPAVRFVHVTVPLTHVQSGPKALVKKVIRRAPGGYADNVRREQFNDLMRREYKGREPLFDLAAVESTRPEGGQELFTFKGSSGRALFPPYGSDGRHLNEMGRRRVAEELVVFLAGLVPTKATQGVAAR